MGNGVFTTDGIQAVQLEDGSTAYISTNIYSDQNNVNAASLSMETFAQQVGLDDIVNCGVATF